MSMFSNVPPDEHLSVLRADPELGERLDDRRRRRAERASAAVVVRRDSGQWNARDDADLGRDGLGLLVIEGVLVRRVGMEDRHAAELLADGDILQPAEHDGEEATLPFEATWKVLTPLTLAVLDLDWMHRMAPYPEVVAALARRIMVRSRRLASTLAITQRHRLEDRLRLMFWELADRYGRVGPQGVRIEVELTHDLLSHLVGAHRPSVSVALGRLERSGHVRREQGRWLLKGPPPSLLDTVDPGGSAHPRSRPRRD